MRFKIRAHGIVFERSGFYHNVVEIERIFRHPKTSCCLIVILDCVMVIRGRSNTRSSHCTVINSMFH